MKLVSPQGTPNTSAIRMHQSTHQHVPRAHATRRTTPTQLARTALTHAATRPPLLPLRIIPDNVKAAVPASSRRLAFGFVLTAVLAVVLARPLFNLHTLFHTHCAYITIFVYNVMRTFVTRSWACVGPDSRINGHPIILNPALIPLSGDYP